MNRELIEKAIGNISEQYKDEALEYQCKATVSEINGMNTKNKKRIVTVGIAAALIVAVGATAYASGAFKIKKRTPAPKETLSATYRVEDPFDGNDVAVVEYTGIDKIIEVEGPKQSREIELRLKKSPEGFKYEVTGDPTNWNCLLQGEGRGGCFNVETFYMPLFSEDGCLFILDDIYSENEFIGEDGFQHYKVSAVNNDDPSNPRYNYYHFIFDEQAGHVILAVSSISEEFTDSLLADLEIRDTGRTVAFDTSDDHIYLVNNGVG